MLHLKKHHFTHSLTIFQPVRVVALSPVADEDDELIRAIEADHEEAWQLEATADASGLDSFWNGVERDLQGDPDWVDFAKEDD